MQIEFISRTHFDYNMNTVYKFIILFQESCHSSVQELAKNINEQDYDVKTNVFLSIFKIADVGISYPEDNSSSLATRIFPIAIFLLPFLVYAINDGH